MSKIEWTDETWNPLTGCTKVSPGCDHCYAKTMHERFNDPGSFDTVTLHPERLDQPLRWRKPRKVFVNSMSDLFHQDVPDEFIARVFATMSSAGAHTFQILTKRHARMRALLNEPGFREDVEGYAVDLLSQGPSRQLGWPGAWPLPNVWLGVSVENQQWADIRIPALLDTPAAVRFLSCEPLLGPVDIDRALSQYTLGQHLDDCHRCCVPREVHGAVDGHSWQGAIDWVIVGGESGRGARPMHPDWARAIRDECETYGVPFLFKQWGEFAPAGPEFSGPGSVNCAAVRMGKKAAGRLLDGRTWDEYPDSPAAHSFVGHQKESA